MCVRRWVLSTMPSLATVLSKPVRVACWILDNLSDALVKRVEAEVVEAAHRQSLGPLEKEIWDILLRVAPEGAA